MADGRNRQVLVGNDTLCMTGIVDRRRHQERKRSLPAGDGCLPHTCISPLCDSSVP